MNGNVKLEIRNVSKIFGKNPQKVISLLDKGYSKHEIFEKTKQTIGLNNVSFKVYEGETFVIMGLSGSGKSTLLRCINRLIDPTSGSILIDGQDIAPMDAEALRKIRRSKLGMVFQNFALLPHRTVLENVAYGLEIQGVQKEERYAKAEVSIETVGLKGYEQSKITQLSGGMKQRVGLARALANNPDILLMDEAFSALDPLIRSEMQDELLSLEDAMQKTIIFVSHDLDEALKLGDRIALMKDGEVVQIGTPEEILTNPADSYVSKFVAGVDRSKVLTAEAVMWRPEPVVAVSSGPRVAVQLMKEHGISSIFVVEGKNRILKGILMIDDAVEALKSKKSFEPVIREVPSIPPEMPLNEIIPLIADSEYPLPVVNENGKLKGIIVRGTVLGALAMSEDTANGEAGDTEAGDAKSTSEAVTTEASTTEASTTEAGTTEAITSEVGTSEAVTSEVIMSETITTDVKITAEAVTTEATAAEATAAEATAVEALSPEGSSLEEPGKVEKDLEVKTC